MKILMPALDSERKIVSWDGFRLIFRPFQEVKVEANNTIKYFSKRVPNFKT